jgi:hypothetical protein
VDFTSFFKRPSNCSSNHLSEPSADKNIRATTEKSRP